MRGCIDLTTINPYLKYEHFKMEGLHTVQSQLRRRDHMWKVDMSDFYMHLLIAEEHHLFFRFRFEGIRIKPGTLAASSLTGPSSQTTILCRPPS